MVDAAINKENKKNPQNKISSKTRPGTSKFYFKFLLFLFFFQLLVTDEKFIFPS